MTRSSDTRDATAPVTVSGSSRCMSPNVDEHVHVLVSDSIKTELAGQKLDDGSEFREGVDERTPMERVATPDEVSGAVLSLASDAASFTTGEILTIDGGYTGGCNSFTHQSLPSEDTDPLRLDS